jgi:hypothetical protein
MQQFSFTIKHKSGALNKVADARSRRTSLLTTMTSEVIGFELLKDSLSIDPFFSPILEDVSTRAQGGFVLHNGFLFKGTQLCILEGSLRLKIIKERHDKGSLGFSYFLQVPAVGTKGGLVLAWKPSFDLEPILLNLHHISCLVYSDPLSSPWLLSCIHDPSNWNLRFDFWSLLKNIGFRFGGPWLLVGDFNAILAFDEKQGGRDFGSSSHNVFVDFCCTNFIVLASAGVIYNKVLCKCELESIRRRVCKNQSSI